LVLRTPRFLVVALPVVLAVAALSFRPQTADRTSARHPTVEPSLPLTIDLHEIPADPDRGQPPRLEATVASTSELREVSLSLILPEGVEADETELLAKDRSDLRRGELRVVSIPLLARHGGAFPIRLQASFRLPDGREFRTEQGILWSSAGGGPAGRHNAGAYEWMGVPVSEPQP
jgi:hypothetical protein